MPDSGFITRSLTWDESSLSSAKPQRSSVLAMRVMKWAEFLDGFGPSPTLSRDRIHLWQSSVSVSPTILAAQGRILSADEQFAPAGSVFSAIAIPMCCPGAFCAAYWLSIQVFSRWKSNSATDPRANLHWPIPATRIEI